MVIAFLFYYFKYIFCFRIPGSGEYTNSCTGGVGGGVTLDNINITIQFNPELWKHRNNLKSVFLQF